MFASLPPAAAKLEEMVDRKAVESWSAVEGEPLWTVVDAAGSERTERGLLVRPAAERARLVRAGLEGFEIESVRLRVTGDPRTLWARWADEGVPFSEEASVRLRVPEAARGAAERSRWFELDLEAVDRFDRLAIDLRAPGDVVVHEIELFDRSVVESGDQAVWATLDGVRRPALILGSETTRRWDLDAPIENGVLTASLGAVSSAGPIGELRFRATAETVEGEEIKVVDERLPVVELVDRWADRQWTLPAGRAIRALTLRVDGHGTAGTASGLWSHPEVGTIGATAPNLILLSLDTLRADRMSLYGHQRATTPRLEAWAERASAVVFERAFATAPRTLPSHASIFSGLDATTHGVNFHSPVPDGLLLLSEMLYDQGWSTHAVTGGGLLHARFGFAQGFQSFAAWDVGMTADQELDRGVERAFEVLDHVSPGRPFFLFFHTYEIHDPYRARSPLADGCLGGRHPEMVVSAPFAERLGAGRQKTYDLRKHARNESADGAERVTEADLEWMRCLYDSGVARVDDQVGGLLEALESQGLLENTVVVVTSDHGESLGEEGRAKHAYLVDSDLRVPLIVHAPGSGGGLRRVERQVSLVDVAPTVLDLLGLEAAELDPSPRFDGASLVALLDRSPGAEDPERTEEPSDDDGRREAWSYAGIENRGLALRVDDRLRYVYDDTPWIDPSERERLYDRRGDRETRLDAPEVAERLRARVRGRLETDAAGARLELANRGCSSLSISLRGPSIGEERLKVAPGTDARFELLAPRHVRVDLETGERAGLRLLIPDGSLVVELRGVCEGAPVSRRQTVELPSLTTARSILEIPGVTARWTPPPDGSEVEVTVDSAEDRARREQLKALGYVD